jgi:tetratricopeptide (TPR) repeat protein
MTPSAHAQTANPPAAGRPASSRRWLPFAILTALILFHVVSNIVWLQQDGRSLYGDTGNHARASMTIFEILRTPSPDMLSRIGRATTFWPPLAYLLTQPLYILFGVSTDVTSFTTTLWFALAILFTYFIGRKLYGWRAGLLAAFVFSFYPAVYLQSRTYYVDIALTAMVLISLYCLLRTDAFRQRTASLVFGFALGLAALTKNAFIIMTIGPALAVAAIALASGGLTAWRQLLSWQPGQRLQPQAGDLVQRLLNMALAGILVVLLAAPWYLSHLGILAFNAGEVTRDVHLANKPVIWYPLKFDEALLIWPYLLLLVGLVVGLLRVRRHWFALLWLISGVAIITMVTRQNVRYLLPVMPAAALLSAYWIISLRSRLLRTALIGLTALFQVALFFVMSWGAPSVWNLALDVPVQNAHNPFNDNTSDRPLAIDPWAFLYYQYPPRPHRWPVDEITAALIDDIERSGQAHQVNRFVSLSKLLDFEYSTFAYEAELARMQGQPGAANLMVGDVPQRDSYLTDFLDFDYVLVKSNDKSTLAGRQNHRAVRELWTGGDAVLRQRFTPLQRWELQDGTEAELFKRSGPPLALLSPQELRPILQHVLELTPQNGHAQGLLALLDAPVPAWQWRSASQLWRGIVRDDPNNAAAWQKLADALLVTDPQAVLDEIQRAQRRGILPATQLALLYQQGRAWEALGDPQQAEAAYLLALQLAPDAASTQAALGAFYLRQGQIDRAREQYSALTARNGQTPVAVQVSSPITATANPAEQPPDVAREVAAAEVEPAPSPSQAQPDLALGVEALLVALAEATPDDAMAQMRLGAWALQQGQSLSAAGKHFQRAIDLDPTAWLTYGLWANSLGNSGQISQALQIIGQGLAAAPESPGLPAMQARLQGAAASAASNQAYQAALEAARNAARERNWQDAIDAAQQAIALAPARYEAQVLLGDAYRSQNEFAQALQAYQRAVELAPYLSVLHSRQAEMLAHLGRADEAMAASLTALAIDQGRWENWFALGRSYMASVLAADAPAGSPTPAEAARQAETALLRAQALAPADNQAPARSLAELRAALQQPTGGSAPTPTPEAVVDYARMNGQQRAGARDQADQALRAGKPAEALAIYQALAAVDGQDRASRMGVANALAALGRVDQALAELGAISLDWPDFPFSLIRQGALLEEQGHVEGALAAYREAVRIAPDNPDTHFTLAYALNGAGWRAEAIAAFEAGLSLDPGRSAARQALEEIIAAGR